MRLTSCLLLCLALGACTAVPTLEPPDNIASRQVLSVPFFPQQAYYCGPAALAEVANYRGVKVDQSEVGSKVFIPERKGSLTVEMVAASRQLGLLPYPLAPELSSLLRELDAGNPVLVLQNQGFSWLPQWHYALAVGYDLNDRVLVLHSGEQKNYRLPLATFVRTWQRADFWARVVVDGEHLPATAEPMPYLRSALAFAQTGHPELAYGYYQRALTQWPEHPGVLTANANAALETGDSHRARQLFEQLLRSTPKDPALWNNYAYALQADGCERAALKAIAIAVQLAPEEEAYRRSAEDFANPAWADPAHCPGPANTP